jgi:putative hydrolase of the HAD superfamily
VLDEIERATSAGHGYGATAFTYSLQACYSRLAEREIDQTSLRTVLSFGERILRADIELIDGVQETLNALAARHHLTLFTKGHPEEQRLKIDRSGLADHFLHHEIVAEKRVDAYVALAERIGAMPSRTWMVGNSPKSDINPALAAGWNAVFIPHEHTWALEHAEVEHAGDRLLVLPAFRELLRHF